MLDFYRGNQPVGPVTEWVMVRWSDMLGTAALSDIALSELKYCTTMRIKQIIYARTCIRRVVSMKVKTLLL